jgi:hypothetical protein
LHLDAQAGARRQAAEQHRLRERPRLPSTKAAARSCLRIDACSLICNSCTWPHCALMAKFAVPIGLLSCRVRARVAPLIGKPQLGTLHRIERRIKRRLSQA